MEDRNLIISIEEDGINDITYFDSLVSNLLIDLKQIDITAKRIPKDNLPSNLKGTGLDVNSIVVALLASSGAITTLLNLLQSYLARNEKRSIRLSFGKDILEVNNLSTDEQRRLVREWLKQHQTPKK